VDEPTTDDLVAASCWEPDDVVAGRPSMTTFRQRTRWQQAVWRERHGHPIGSQPIRPRPGQPMRPVGSRIPLEYGQATGANLVTEAALVAARARTANAERHQSFDHQRLWADLLSSGALAFNLFGDLAADLALADRAVHAWWPDAPGTVSEVRFAHSPGRLDRAYLGNLSAFDVAFVLEQPAGGQAVIALDVRFHERSKREQPKPQNLGRYQEVADRSGVFAEGYLATVSPGDLLEMWLEHLLMLSMLQHPTDAWTWGRYVTVYPAANSDVADARARYAGVVVDASTYHSMTLEALLAPDALPTPTAAALRERYRPG
jgi:hypothetical protein